MKREVFISTGYYKNTSPFEVYNRFIDHNINLIEFSGGKYINDRKLQRLKFLKNKKTKIRIHNYFPVPKSKFVINLASSDKVILKKSIFQLKKYPTRKNLIMNIFLSMQDLELIRSRSI